MQPPAPVGTDLSLPLIPASTQTTVNAAQSFTVNGVQVLGPRRTGWAAQTTGLSRGDMGGAPTLANVASTLAALITDLIAHGTIGP